MSMLTFNAYVASTIRNGKRPSRIRVPMDMFDTIWEWVATTQFLPPGILSDDYVLWRGIRVEPDCLFMPEADYD